MPCGLCDDVCAHSAGYHHGIHAGYLLRHCRARPHTDDCYELPGTPAHKEIQCTAGADLGQGEYIVHKHDSFCFDDSGELLCALAEQDEHVHTDACYDGDSLICGLVTGIVHQHTADCVISVPATEPQIGRAHV